MPSNLNIVAEVVDIRSDHPSPSDRFLVDTNVWYWLTYNNASLNAWPYQIRFYPSYLKQARGAGSRLLHSTLSLPELMHTIERNESKIFGDAAQTTLTLKEFRHDYAAQRQQVIAEIRQAWSLVAQLSAPLEMTVDVVFTTAALADLDTTEVDGYDLYMLQGMKQQGITQIITDDGDFTTVQGIQVYTANGNIIAQAMAQGQLLRR